MKCGAALLLIALLPSCGNPPQEAALMMEIAAAPDDPRLGRYETTSYHWGYQEYVVLGPHGVFLHHETGCYVEPNAEGGRWSIEGEELHLRFESWQTEDRTYLWVPWDRGAFLVPPGQLAYFTSNVEAARQGDDLGQGILARDFRDIREEPLSGFPDLPSPWKERAAADVETQLLALTPREGEHGIYDATIRGDASTGLWQGQQLRRRGDWGWGTLAVESTGDGTSTARLRLHFTEDVSPETVVGESFGKTW